MIEQNKIELCAEILHKMTMEEFVPNSAQNAQVQTILYKGLKIGGRPIGAARELLYLLHRLGITIPDPQCPSNIFSYFLDCELHELGKHLSNIGTKTDVALSDIMDVFALNMVLQNGIYPEERTLFSPPNEYKYLTQLLHRHEYVVEANGKYKFTDKIGPAMLEAGLWNNKFESRRTVQKRHTVLAARLAWTTMPKQIKRLYFSSAAFNQKNLFSLCWALDNMLKEGKWLWASEDMVYIEIKEVAKAIVTLSNDK